MNRIFITVLEVVLEMAATGAVFWLLFRTLKRSRMAGRVILRLVLSAVIVAATVYFDHKIGTTLVGDIVSDSPRALLLVGSIALCGILLSILWTPHLSVWLVSPLTSAIDGGNELPEPKPLYSIAKARRKRGEFLEAIVAIREQLAKFPNDYEGVMLLAGIQAEDTKDLPSAEITLNRFCDQPDVPPDQFAAAMTQLAHWHLKLAQDADSARGALEKIHTRFPRLSAADLARTRLNRLKLEIKGRQKAVQTSRLP